MQAGHSDTRFQLRRIDALPDLLVLHERAPLRYPHLLESAASGPSARHDILFAFPGATLVADEADASGFLRALDRIWRDEACSPPTNGPAARLPFRGGWFLYLGYELAGEIEPCLRLERDDPAWPVALATRFPAAVVRDRLSGSTWLVAEQPQLLDAMQADIAALSTTSSLSTVALPGMRIRLQEPPAQDYLEGVARVLDYIRDGDVFQVNLSRRWQGHWPDGLSPAVLYRRLRAANPGPFNGLATFGGQGERAILSSSPERLLQVQGDRVQTRPIAGTRPRGGSGGEDARLSGELLGHPKERAEHIMLIDLERNDLGRIAHPGSVEVNELMVLESYASVHHIVSNVRARLRPAVTPGDVIRALFPGGTITGCPKVRCMQIIAELEQGGRGAYTGSMGYLNRDGSMDLNILIRTLVRTGQQLSLRAGAGIVADSDPRRELQETRAKARAMLRALEEET
ncbi:MAG TPA: aminodeoxychorismate synthase component I [Gammaproteobacteria bacterium]|nr:aminodeoxychorismate synthase component I [Gammaproteobacteria bacterium]